MAKGPRSRSRTAARNTRTSSSDHKSPPRDRGAAYCAIAVGVAAAAVYLNAFGNDFVLDDIPLIRDNLRIRSLGNVPGFFAAPYWDLEGAHALYRPLVLTTYAINYAVHGLSTHGYTAVNIGLHVVVSLLLFAVVRTIGGSLLAAAAAGILFAVHPVHTEAVTSLTGRPELLAALFFLLAMLFHRLASRAAEGINRYRIATWACFALALLSKESAITLLLILPLMDVSFAETRDRRELTWFRSRLVGDYVPLVLVAIGYLALRRSAIGAVLIAGDAIAPLDNPLVPVMTTPLGERMGATAAQAIMTAFAVVPEYARLLVWPARLSPDYSYNQIPLVTSAVDGRLLVGVAIVIACTCGIALLWRRHRLAAFGLAFLALTFSIVSNFAITIGTICAERLVYLPSAGLLIAAAAGAAALSRHQMWRRVIYATLGVLVVMGAARTWTRNADWQSDLSLWSAALAVAPDSARVQTEYGRVQLRLAEEAAQAGRSADAEKFYQTAEAHYERALEIYPSYALPMDGLANILSVHQRFDEALVLYERALKVWPGNYASLTNWAGLLWDRSTRTAARAAALRAEGKALEADALDRQAADDSRAALQKVDGAIAMRPSYAHAHLIRALLLDASDPPAAIAEFEEVLRLMPSHPQRPQIDKELQRLRAQQSSGAPQR